MGQRTHNAETVQLTATSFNTVATNFSDSLQALNRSLQAYMAANSNNDAAQSVADHWQASQGTLAQTQQFFTEFAHSLSNSSEQINTLIQSQKWQ